MLRAPLILLIFGVFPCESYKVAVIEYHRDVYPDFEANIKHNLDNYLKIIEEIVRYEQKMDMIVFPEGTLIFQPSYTKEEILKHAALLPKDNETIPCHETSEMTDYLKEISCSSKTHNVYVSVNIIEKSESDDLFNTNIVFDRQGRLVSKYRKIKPLTFEKFISPGTKAEYFETDFGVTVGVFICFDIFFKDSYQEYLEKVDAFIFPSYWYSELPFLSSTQVQNMWAYLHEKVLLASGGNNGASGSSGSGVYTGRNNSHTSYLSSQNSNKILITEISPKSSSKTHSSPVYRHVRELNGFKFIEKRPEMQIHQFTKDNATNEIEDTLCDGKFCCKYKLNVNDTSGLFFVIYNGMQPFLGFGRLGIQLCAVLQCEDQNCFTIPNNEYFKKSFKSLEVQVVNSTEDVVYYPNLALNDLFFVPTDDYTFEDNNLHLKVTKETVGIYTFGFYGRNYKIDDVK